MKQQQRRVFLKVLAISPLVGCGADPSAPNGVGGGDAGSAAGGSSGSGGSPAFGGAGNPSLGGGGNPAFGGSGTSTGGANQAGTNAGGTNAGGTSAGGSPINTGGQSGAHATSGGGATAAGGDPNNPETPIGNVSAYPLGSFKIAGTIFFLGHDAGGLYAMSMQCTHAGCACVMKGTELDCPCHGSAFDHLGNVLKGPATKPLPHYPVFVDATGNITVDRFTIVSQSTRTPV